VDVNGLWWALALSEEITSAAPAAFTCDGVDYVMFRDRAGVVRCLEDRCAHRRAPLSLGRIRDDGTLQCGYHGWSFEGGGGRCVDIAILGKDERAPASYGVRAFAVREQGGMAHVWSGALATADTSRLRTSIGPAPVAGETTTAALLIAVPHAAFVEALLDGPHLVMAIGGLEIYPEPVGDPRIHEGLVVAEYAVAEPGPPHHRTQRTPDAPYLLRVAVEPLSGKASISVQTLDERPVITAVAAPVPRRMSVTGLRARVQAAAPFSLSFHPALDAAGLDALAWNAGGDLWRRSTAETGATAGGTNHEHRCD
jgi:nitrite reductase/ring-hydroxylating ferredoxin subunit